MIAIKVLPEHVAESPERNERFEREAKAFSQLNHPNICTLHASSLTSGAGRNLKVRVLPNGSVRQSSAND